MTKTNKRQDRENTLLHIVSGINYARDCAGQGDHTSIHDGGRILLACEGTAETAHLFNVLSDHDLNRVAGSINRQWQSLMMANARNIAATAQEFSDQ